MKEKCLKIQPSLLKANATFCCANNARLCRWMKLRKTHDRERQRKQERGLLTVLLVKTQKGETRHTVVNTCGKKNNPPC